MSNEPVSPTLPPLSTAYVGRFPTLHWSAIIGGTIAAIGLHLLLTTLGAAAGLAIFTPVSDTNPVSNFSIGAAVVWSVCALVALWFGAALAGRFSHSLHSGFVHGILVWALTLIITVVLVSTGGGVLVSGTMGAVGKLAAPAVAGVAAEGAKQLDAQTNSFVEESSLAGTDTSLRSKVRAQREIGFAVGKLFRPGNDPASPENRKAVIQALVTYRNMSEAEATQTVDDWTKSYNNLTADLNDLKKTADEKARVAADQAAGNLSCAAMWAFFSLLIGLLVSTHGGSFGAKRYLMATSDPV